MTLFRAKQNVFALILALCSADIAAQTVADAGLSGEISKIERLIAEGGRREALELARQAFARVRENGLADTTEALANITTLAVTLEHLDQAIEAEQLYRRAMTWARSASAADDPLRQTIIKAYANFLSGQGRLAEFEAVLRELLEIQRLSLNPDHPDILESLNALAGVLSDRGHYSESETVSRDLVKRSRETLGIDHPDTLRRLNDLGVVVSLAGRSGEASEIFSDVAERRRLLLGSDHPDTLASRQNLAAALKEQGRYDDAERIYREVIPITRAILGDSDPQTLEMISNLASLLKARGQYGEAEQYYSEVMRKRIASLGKDHPDTLRSINNLASTLGAQGRHEEAEPLYRQALEGRRRVLGDDHPSTLGSLNNLAVHLIRQARNEEAEPLLREAAERSVTVLGALHPRTLKAKNNLAEVLRLLGRYAEAEELYRAVLEGKQEALGEDHPSTLISMHNLAGNMVSQERFGDAAGLYIEVLETAQGLLGATHPLILRARENLSMSYILAGRFDNAADSLRHTGEALLQWADIELYTTRQERVRRLLLNSQFTFQNLSIGLARLEPTPRTVALAADVMLQWKGLAGEHDALLSRLTSRSQDQRVQELARIVRELRGELATAVGQGDPGAAELLVRLEAAEGELSRINLEYIGLDKMHLVTSEAVRQSLAPGEVLLEFRQYQPYLRQAGPIGGFGPPRIAAVLISADAATRFADLGAVVDAEALLHKIVGRRRPSDEPARRLSTMLLGPFEAQLAAARRVYIAPDALLNLVPFGRLPFGGSRYWLEAQDIRIVQSGRALLRERGRPTTSGLLAVGGIDFTDGGEPSLIVAALDAPAPVDARAFRSAGRTLRGAFSEFQPLPESRSEVNAIARLYASARQDEPVEIWLGNAARERRIKDMDTPPRTLHFATHGFYLPRNETIDRPMLLSGLPLAGANRGLEGEIGPDGEDGVLYAIEAMGLNLQGTELVVLSACETIQGAADYSEGVYGLARAFRIAGADNILMTLWPLDDSLAREFMEDFYANFLGGYDDPAEALRQTKREWAVSGDPERANPFSWAPYILIQNGR